MTHRTIEAAETFLKLARAQRDDKLRYLFRMDEAAQALMDALWLSGVRPNLPPNHAQP